MANLSLGILIAILVVAVLVALVIGYFVGSRLGGRKSTAMKQATEEHDSYKSDVREHFQQTSAIMSRMVEDYRDMYDHMSTGAEKLADLHREKLVTPPPRPESITHRPEQAKSPAGAKSDKPSTSAQSKGEHVVQPNQFAGAGVGAGTQGAGKSGAPAAKPATAADAKVNGGKPSQAPGPQPSDAAKHAGSAKPAQKDSSAKTGSKKS